MAFLLPFVQSLVGLAAPIVAAKAAITSVAPHFFNEGYAPAPSAAAGLPTGTGPGLTRYVAPYTAEYATIVSPTGGAITPSSLAIPGVSFAGGSIPRTLLKWLQKYAVIYGPAVATAVWEEFQKRRRSGQTTALARASIDQAYPEIHRRILRGGRRRMNPANIRALRRALRRVRSFKRVTRKVKGLGLSSHRGGRKYYARPRRRGDLWEMEELADLEDEAEDLGVDDFFED